MRTLDILISPPCSIVFRALADVVRRLEKTPSSARYPQLKPAQLLDLAYLDFIKDHDYLGLKPPFGQKKISDFEI